MVLWFIRRGSSGPFAITDLQLAGGGADLDVSVKEADGSVTTYLVPYAAVPNMLQPGVSKYDFAAGRSHIEGRANKVILSGRVISMVLITY